MTIIAEIKKLSVAFESERQTVTAVDDIEFNLHSGETLALLGESGCGKSLTSLALMRLLPDYGRYGAHSEVWVGEEDLLELPERRMRTFRGRRLAMIFQEPMTALNPVLTIGQQLAEALQAGSSMTRSMCQEKMIALLQEVEMPEPEKRLRQYPHQLSGGQKQRVVIAMALSCNPQILIADEPTTALDVTIQAQILKLLKKIQRQHQMSLLLITHDLGVVKAVADRVCVMYAGQVVEMAPADAFFHQPLHPYSQQLLVSLPSIAKRGRQLQMIQGNVPVLDAMPSGCRFHPRCVHVFEPCPDQAPRLEASETQENRRVRCHLYPDRQQPPALPEKEQSWAVRTVDHSETLLCVQNLSVQFGRKSTWFSGRSQSFKAVDGLNFELKKGKTLAIVGESGCGKTTTARAIMRLQPIHAGKILYQGQNVAQMKGRKLRQFRKKVQIIFQDPFSSMNPRMTVGEILAEGMLAQGMLARQIEKKQARLLEHVNLAKTSLTRYPHQFSGGQRQRICIARALATEPELLVCDEPTSALDISVQAQILNLLKQLQQEYGLSYLFITHNMGVVSYLADDILVMRAGRMVEYKTCEEIFKNPVESYTRQLLSSVLLV